LMASNGSTWDRWRNNIVANAIPQAVRQTSVFSPEIVNYNGRGMVIFFKVLQAPGTTDTVQLVVNAVDDQNYTWTIFAGNQISSAPTNEKYLIYPGCSGTNGYYTICADIAIPRRLTIGVIHTGIGQFEYYVDYAFIV